jgi:hypothetical protein
MNRKINIAELEFDQIKENLKEYLRGQARFSDYDFEGSNMAILLDLLAYNTHYNAMYTNMALNESYLESASRRDSVVSLAKNLGYVPRSSVCACARINFKVSGVFGNPQFLTVNRNTEFGGTKDNIRYTFYVTEDVTAQRDDNNEYHFRNIDVIEGTFLTSRFDYTESNQYVIPNPNVDVSTIVVKVQQSPSSTAYTTFASTTELASLTSESRVFFVQENDNQLYQLSFGDGVLGYALSAGNIITAEYYICNGEAPNGISSLSYGGSSFYGGSVSEIVLNGMPVNGGRNPESIEEIRFNAPSLYAAQNRAVTTTDYESLILSRVPSISAVSVWGGEHNEPPVYGKVFISAKTSNNEPLTYAEQQQITAEVLNKYKLVTIIPEFVVPELINIELNVVAYYNPAVTHLTPDDLKSQIVVSLLRYNETELEKFNKILRQSVISRTVESVNSAIISTVVRTKIHRTMQINYNTASVYQINIGNPLTPNTITTSGFFIQNRPSVCYIEDDGVGRLTLYTVVAGARTNISTVGTVDYRLGKLNITNLTIVRSEEVRLRISAITNSPDIVSVYNQIAVIDTSRLFVDVIADRTANSRTTFSGGYIFTPNTL